MDKSNIPFNGPGLVVNHNEAEKPELPVDNIVSGLIPEEDYAQVFEETCMSVIEGLVKHGHGAKILNTPQMLKKWVDFYWNKQNS